MIETQQPSLGAGCSAFKQLAPQSPEMTRKEKKAIAQVHAIVKSGNGNVVRNSKKLPPRPPPVIEEKSEPPSHLQLASSEDLSFADFSALEDSCSEDHNNPSLSGFLEEPVLCSARRRRKVNAVDVASVGNASDTMVHNIATRDLHEKAKMAFNAADYSSALPLFESILTAQVRRFSPLHPSVGAAMHNVGVSSYSGRIEIVRLT